MRSSESIAKLAPALVKARSTGWWQDARYPKYLIGDAGEVYSERGRGRVLKPIKAGDRYLKVTLKGSDGSLHGRYVHQLVAESFIGPRPKGHQVRHLNGNPKDNAVDNLAYGTPSENYRDKIIHGRDTGGERNGMAKLSWGTVEKMRLDLQSMRQCEVADKYGVSRMNVSRIARGVSWK